MTTTIPHPSGAGTLALGTNEAAGALILHVPAELDGREIEISPGYDPTAARTPARVWPRHAGAARRYSAVYPDLAEGRWTVWRSAFVPAVTVTVPRGHITTSGLRRVPELCTFA